MPYPLTVFRAAGGDVYVRLFDDEGRAFDFDDNAFKTLGSATTPHVVATERGDMNGTGESGYVAGIDLAAVHPGAVPKTVFPVAFENATPAASDVAIETLTPLTIQAGRLGPRSVRCGLDAAFTTTAGTTVRFAAWLEVGGELLDLATVDLSSACTVTVREHGSGTDLFSVSSSGGPGAAGTFELSQPNPNFTDDRLYLFTVAITTGGETFTTLHALPVHS